MIILLLLVGAGVGGDGGISGFMVLLVLVPSFFKLFLKQAVFF